MPESPDLPPSASYVQAIMGHKKLWNLERNFTVTHLGARVQDALAGDTIQAAVVNPSRPELW